MHRALYSSHVGLLLSYHLWHLGRRKRTSERGNVCVRRGSRFRRRHEGRRDIACLRERGRKRHCRDPEVRTGDVFSEAGGGACSSFCLTQKRRRSLFHLPKPWGAGHLDRGNILQRSTRRSRQGRRIFADGRRTLHIHGTKNCATERMDTLSLQGFRTRLCSECKKETTHLAKEEDGRCFYECATCGTIVYPFPRPRANLRLVR